MIHEIECRLSREQGRIPHFMLLDKDLPWLIEAVRRLQRNDELNQHGNGD